MMKLFLLLAMMISSVAMADGPTFTCEFKDGTVTMTQVSNYNYVVIIETENNKIQGLFKETKRITEVGMPLFDFMGNARIQTVTYMTTDYFLDYKFHIKTELDEDDQAVGSIVVFEQDGSSYSSNQKCQ
jgi:hypothetical protein